MPRGVTPSILLLFAPGLGEILAEIIAVWENVILQTHGNSRYTVRHNRPVLWRRS